jgi:AcrR family transcriptional regulator
MASIGKSVTGRARPGGRTAEISKRIHEAIIALLAEGGHDACTYPRIAAKAGVERSTLYRRYPDRWAMLGEAYVAMLSPHLDVVPGASFRDDLRAHLRKVAEVLWSPLGTAMIAAGAVARIDPDSRQSAGRFWRARLEKMEPFVAAAIARGELDPEIDREALFGTADGPLYFRRLIVGVPVDDELIERVVGDVCRLYARTARLETAC